MAAAAWAWLGAGRASAQERFPRMAELRRRLSNCGAGGSSVASGHTSSGSGAAGRDTCARATVAPERATQKQLWAIEQQHGTSTGTTSAAPGRGDCGTIVQPGARVLCRDGASGRLGCDRRRPWRIRGRDQGGTAWHVRDLRREARNPRGNLPERGLHPFQGAATRVPPLRGGTRQLQGLRNRSRGA
eukprot:scaffold1481_cov401-Prasinococcus_capsulatus_cf.AAC.7